MLLKALCKSSLMGKLFTTKTCLPARQALRIMKITAIILLSACLTASATGFSQKVTLSEKNARLEKLFDLIKEQTGYNFLYTVEQLRKAERITIDLKEVDLETALQHLFRNQPLTYNIIEKTVVIKPKPVMVSQEELPPPITIRGRVINQAGEPVAGASILVKGSKTQGTSTNANGEFELKDVDENATLTISGVSIETLEVNSSGFKAGELRVITAKTKINQGEEVIIEANTGYQKIKLERFVGSISSLDSANYHRRAGMNIIERLDGTTPGLLFDKKSGNKIQVRGITTLEGIPGSSSAPLIVVDNFPYYGSLDLINPNDVADITVLKDAAAASIWGTQAGNGVIVITTKKGKLNQPLSISISSNVTINSKPDLSYYPAMNAADFISVEQFLFNKGYYNSALVNTTTYPVLSPAVEIFAKRRAGLLSAADSANQINSLTQYDLRNELEEHVYRKQINQQHYLNLSGGNKVMNYTFSAGFNNNGPAIQGGGNDKQYTLSSMNTFYPVKNLIVEAGINYSRINSQSVNFSLPKLYSYARLVDENGASLAVPNTYRMSYVDTVGGGKLLDWHYRPIDEINLSDNSTALQLNRLNFKVSYKFTSWLKADVLYQGIQQSSATKNHFNRDSYYARNEINRFSQITGSNVTRRIPLGGILNLSNGLLRSNNWRAQLNINKHWNNKHELSSVIAGETSDARISSSAARYYGYDDRLSSSVSGLDFSTVFPTLPSGSDRIPQGGTVSDEGQVNRTVSILGNIAYTYNNRYSVYASARRDGANIFGVNTNNKWKPLWSVGGGWDISEEPFFNYKWIPYLRLRASYGYTGNANNQFSGLSTMLYSSAAAQYTNLIYAQLNNPPNPDLRWEEVSIFNTGLDFKLFNDRISGSFDVFSKKSKDVISPVPFDPTTGLDFFTVNSASLKGKGFDLSITSQNTKGAFSWESRFALSYARSIVTEVYDSKVKAADFIVYGVNQSKGRVAYGIASYRWAGLDPVTGDPRGMLNKVVSKNYTGIFNDSVDNQVFHGSAIPLYSGYLGNSFSWKGFTLSANITYRLAYYFRKPTINYNSLFTNWESHADYSLRWQKPGDEEHTSIPSLVYPANSNRDMFYQYSEINVLKGDNIKLQDLRLQYTLNGERLKNFPINSVQMFMYANNLNMILWKANKEGYDPDFTGGKISLLTPVPKTLTLGVNINF